ncbi:MAG TPA: hypothetical protein VNU92_16215 [Edaphobacter sp.]|nr:hypothetical protein [Edaphobacter sp.]
MRTASVFLLCSGVVLSSAGCSGNVNPHVATRLNQDATVNGLPSNPMQGKVITSWINKQDSTMSTMFGNEVAVGYARTNAAAQYPVGSTLSVVTWDQQEDPRWFGGNIPQKVKAIEFVTVTAPGTYSYERFEGSPLKQVAGVDSKDREESLIGMRAAVMP